MKKKRQKRRVSEAVSNKSNYKAARVMGWPPAVMTKWLNNRGIKVQGITVAEILAEIRKDGRHKVPKAWKRLAA